jgi:hypothetical protein
MIFYFEIKKNKESYGKTPSAYYWRRECRYFGSGAVVAQAS